MAGYRVGESHPGSVLTDAEVDQMIEDRGPDESPRMSYSELAEKYHVSKSCVRDIITGSRRGRVSAISMTTTLDIPVLLTTRAKIIKAGGAAWLERVVSEAFMQDSGRGGNG